MFFDGEKRHADRLKYAYVQNKKVEGKKIYKKHSKAIFPKKICCLNDVYTERETVISKTL